MATFGHEGGNWMNDDQRGEMRERARLADPLAGITLSEELTQKLAEETSNNLDWQRLVNAARRGAAEVQAKLDAEIQEKNKWNVRANELRLMLQKLLSVEVLTTPVDEASLAALINTNPTVAYWYGRLRRRECDERQMYIALVLSLAQQNHGLMQAELKRLERSACLYCGQPAGVPPGFDIREALPGVT